VSDPSAELQAATLRRVTRRLIPFMFALYIGAGIFFLGYCLFQIPSNLVLARIGARRWIGGIMITWGLTASAMMLMRGVGSCYALRALLGVVEAGFFPGMILYLTYWFPTVERARAVAGFMTAIPISGVVGGPVSGALLGLNGVAGLAGWQWLFLLEGLPSVLLGASALWYLTDRPADAAWLPAEGRGWLTERLRREQSRQGRDRRVRRRAARLRAPHARGRGPRARPAPRSRPARPLPRPIRPPRARSAEAVAPWSPARTRTRT